MKIFTKVERGNLLNPLRLQQVFKTRIAARLMMMMIVLCTGVGKSWGQTVPAAFDMSGGANFTFTGFGVGTTTTYPANMQGHRFAAEPTNITTPNLTNAPSADFVLSVSTGAIASGSIRNEVAGGISILNTGSNNLGAIVVSINTTGRTSVLVTFTAQQLNAGNNPGGGTARANGLRLQYRVGGTNGTFTDVSGTEYVTTNTAALNPATTFTNIALPSAVDNQPIVQLRWIYYASSGTTGNRNRISLDEVTVSSSPASNAAPTVTTDATPSALSATSATLGGNVTATNGSAITDNGIVYALTATNATPSIGGAGVTQLATASPGSGTGAFSNATGSVLAANSQYSYRAYAINGIGTSYGGASGTTFYTLANVPNAPAVNNPTISTLDVTIDESGNPATTLYAIRENVVNNPTAKYVQANGTLGASAVYQTAATWGTKTVTGLVSGTSYGFGVSAQNGAAVNTAFGTNGTGSTSAAPPPVVTGGSPTATVGVVFSYFISATNAPTSYAVSSGTLPAGLTLNTSTGEITGTPTAAGAVSVDVTASNGSGTSAPATLNFTIAQGSQTITFGALPVKNTLDADFALTATINSPLTITYTSSNTTVATVTGNIVHIVGPGTTNITASQAGDANYTAASDVVQPLTVINIIAKWTFEGVTTTNTGATVTVTGSATADVGTQTSGSSFTGVHSSASTVWSNPAGNGSAKSVSSNNWAVGDYIQFLVNASNYYNLKLSFDQTGSNTGPRDFKIQYSTNGSTFTDFSTYSVPNNAGAAIGWSTGTATSASVLNFDLSAVAALNGASTVYFRITDNSTTAINGTTVASGGANRVDNFTVTGIPMPLYYPKTTATDISQASDWVADVNGLTGTSPANFTSANQNFIINRNSAVLNNWTISGGSNLSISSGSSLEFGPLARFTIGSGSTVDFNGQSVTLKSTATGTASIATISGTLLNASNVTVERYIKLRAGGDGRAYRLLTPTVNTTGNIQANWMEGGMNTAIGTNVDPVPGFGTQISGAGGNANGFDKTLSNASSLYLTNNGTTPTYTAVGSVSTGTMNAKTGYFLYLRGDRNQDMTLPLASNMPTSATTLRTTGTVLSGTQTTFTNAFTGGGAWNLVTNPYPSPIDWSLVQPACTGVTGSYIYWDPNIGSRGGFAAVTTAGVSTPATSATQIIQPGQAFFVESDGNVPTVSIQESHKVAGNNNDVFFTAPTPVESFRTELYFTERNGYRRIADGVIALYDNNYSTAVDAKDTKEINNWDENIAISRDGKRLAIEGRPVIGKGDDLPIFMNNMKKQGYEFEFTPTAFSNTNLKAELVDNFLGTRTLLSVTGTTVVRFNITDDPASAATDRFKVVFGAFGNPQGVDAITLKASAQQNAVAVEWTSKTETDMASYEVERQSVGTAFTKVYSSAATGNSAGAVSYNWLDATAAKGVHVYRVKGIDKAGNIRYSDAVRVRLGNGEPGIVLYPNPVQGRSFTIDLNNLPAGLYLLSLYNNQGQLIYSRQLQHDGSQATRTITPDTDLGKGAYQLQLSGSNGFKTTQSIIKN